jgi:hypothetical protein
VNVALAIVAGLAVAGAVLAVSARDVRATVLGILIVLLAAPLLASPWPSPAAILARVAAGLLAARLLTIGLRGQTATAGTRIGWPAEALAAGAAAVVGFGSHGLGAPALGPAEAQAAGFALIALAISPLVTGRDVLRLGIGSFLLVSGALFIRVGLDNPPRDGEQLVISLLTISLGGAVGVIGAAARAAGGLAASSVAMGLTMPRLPDAHRDTRREVGVEPIPPKPPVAPKEPEVATEPPAVPKARRRRTPRTPKPPSADAS